MRNNNIYRRWGAGLAVAAGLAGTFAAGCAQETADEGAAPAAASGTTATRTSTASNAGQLTTVLSVYKGLT